MARRTFRKGKVSKPFYATNVEWERIKERATARNMSVSEFILACALPPTPPPPEKPEGGSQGLSASERKRLLVLMEQVARQICDPYPPTPGQQPMPGQGDMFETMTPRKAINFIRLATERK